MNFSKSIVKFKFQITIFYIKNGGNADMISNFKIQDNKIFIKNRGEFYGNPYPFIYDIGNKLYEFAIMDSNNFEN